MAIVDIEHQAHFVQSCEVANLAEVADRIFQETSAGIVLWDLDYTLRKTIHKDTRLPGRIPQESVDLLSDLYILGWTQAIVTNQPKKGHQGARLISQNGKRYPIFPTTVAQIIGEENIFGSSG